MADITYSVADATFDGCKQAFMVKLDMFLTLLQLISHSRNTNAQLSTLNHFINLLENTKKELRNSPTQDYSEKELPLGRYETTSSKAKAMSKLLAGYGVEHLMIADPSPSINSKGQLIDTQLIYRNTERNKEILDAIEAGTEPHIANAQKIVVVDMEDFVNKNTMANYHVYEGLSRSQLNKFKEFAATNNFQFGLAEKDGRYAIAVSQDVATRYKTDIFAHDCNLFNKAGLEASLDEIDFLHNIKTRNNMLDGLSSHPTDKTYYIDISLPNNYIEASSDTVTIYSEHGPAQSYRREDVDLRKAVHDIFAESIANTSKIMAVDEKEFLSLYKTSPLNASARLTFIGDNLATTRNSKYLYVMQHICREAEKQRNLDPEKSIIKNLRASVKSLPQDAPAKVTIEQFCDDYSKADKAQKQQMLAPNAKPPIGTVVTEMLRRANENTLTPTQFVLGSIMSNAENIARTNKDSKSLDVITQNIFNVDKIVSFMETQDVVASGLVTSQNPELAENVGKTLSYAIDKTVADEIASNRQYLDNIQKALTTVVATKMFMHIQQNVQSKGNPELKKLFYDNTPEQRISNIKKIEAIISENKTISEAGFSGLSEKSQGILEDLIYDANMQDTLESRMPISELIQMPFFQELSGDSLLSDILENSTIQQMTEVEKTCQYTIASGKTLAGNASFEVGNFDIGVENDLNTETPEMDVLEF